MKFAAAAQATSRTFFAVKCQVSVGLVPAGRADACPTSPLATMATVVSDRSARARRGRPAGGRTPRGVAGGPGAGAPEPRGAPGGRPEGPAPGDTPAPPRGWLAGP